VSPAEDRRIDDVVEYVLLQTFGTKTKEV